MAESWLPDRRFNDAVRREPRRLNGWGGTMCGGIDDEELDATGFGSVGGAQDAPLFAYARENSERPAGARVV